jgi:hypothetical protein
MKKLIKRIIKGKLTRDTDEKYANGFYDLALDIASFEDHDEYVDEIYRNLWEVYEATKKEIERK